jgi:hypothetical protein
MKYLITENRLVKLINNTLGHNLSDRIRMITNWEESPIDCRYMFPSRDTFNKLLNEWGPMYWIRTMDNGVFLAQKRENRQWHIYRSYYNDIYGHRINEFELLNFMGLSMFGISLDIIIDNFVKEEL